VAVEGLDEDTGESVLVRMASIFGGIELFDKEKGSNH
jgi:hypothetical protein